MNVILAETGVLVVLAGLGVLTDIRSRLLPNWLCLVIAIAGLAFAITQGGWAAAGSNVLHGLLALVVGIVLFAVRAIGAGDAKFYAAFAMWFALGKAPVLLLAVSLAGLALFLGWVAYRRLRGIPMVRRATEDSDKFPYGVAIAAGAVVAQLVTNQLI